MIINGDALTVLKRLENNSIHMGVTSPPYYSPGEGLRNYETEPTTWPDGWVGVLGEESTPQQYVEHLSIICNEFRRVLRPDGTFLLNLGDSRAGSGRGPSGKTSAVKKQEERQGFVGTPQKIPPGFKRKDMFGIPFRVGIALQQAGWYWRDCIPWLKRNGMIGSYRDRPVSNIEWILILSKSDVNYYDYVAVMQQASESYNKDKRPRGVLRQRVNENTKYDRGESQFKKQDVTGNQTYTGFNARYAESGSCDKRFLRSSDFFFKTWQGLWLDEENEPLALIANPTSHLWKHTAGFPVMLPETLILAYTSEKGTCPRCGAPFKRLSEKIHSEDGKTYQIVTTGWNPTCGCTENLSDSPVPAMVSDIFAGTSATGVACKKTGRRYIGIEISQVYCDYGEERIRLGK